MTRGRVPAAVNLAAVAMFSLFFTACTMKDSAPADSTKAAEGILHADSTTPSPVLYDSIAYDSVSGSPPSDASGNLTGETTKKGGTLGEVPPRPERDSAFGPIGTMDSDGTVRPIRK
jgi:hypothetical protein